MAKKIEDAGPFEGFPVAALDFYDDLEVDNTKSFWEAHKHIYTESVLAPMKALAAALAEEFGAAKIYRPYRDVRFAKDKTPYKTHQSLLRTWHGYDGTSQTLEDDPYDVLDEARYLVGARLVFGRMTAPVP